MIKLLLFRLPCCDNCLEIAKFVNIQLSIYSMTPKSRAFELYNKIWI